MSLYKTLFETQENQLKTGIIGMIFITVILASVFYVEAQADVANLDELQDLVSAGSEPGGELKESLGQKTFSGHTNERTLTDNKLIIEKEMIIEVSCTLSWQDEESQYPSGTNEPDEFKVSIVAPNTETLAGSDLSTSGSVTATAKLPDYDDSDFAENYVGEWTIIVEAGDCGDDSAFIPILGLRTSPDDGNSWNLEITYKFMEYQEETEEREK